MPLKAIAIIPARYASTRFPGKPLVLIGGKPMVQHVYERCQKVFDLAVVATDDQRIEKAVKAFGGSVVMTSPEHLSGTDRCAEAASILAKRFDFNVVVNVQGDEPFIEPSQLEIIKACFDNDNTEIATLVAPITDSEMLFDQNKVKVVLGEGGNALYFSRQAIPFQRDIPVADWLRNHQYFLHLGLYAYRADVLGRISQLHASKLEMCEKLEQLRWLENGYKITAALTEHVATGIDTPNDLELLNKKLNLNQK